MVVDDEPFVAHALALFLGDENDVTVLNDAREALVRLSSGETYDVILCDVMMPAMSGIELHRALTSTSPAMATRVLFITGGIFTSATRDYLDGVPNDCIDKPPDPFALRALIRKRVAALEERALDSRQTA